MVSQRLLRCVLWFAAVLVALDLAAPARVSACGGLFCNNNQPVNQTAERIVFAKGDDGYVTAVVEILYEGPSERFAWVLPVPGIPEIGVSSQQMFDRLQRASNPEYRLQTEVVGECRENDRPTGVPGLPGEFDDSAPPTVEVLDAGQAGPYDYEVISVSAEVAQPGEEAVQWLQDNDYDVDDNGRERLAPYLEAGMNLIAFRLSKGEDTGSIRPITMRYRTEVPMVPIRPTAVAANDDMGVMVWVLGPSRAVPSNYRDLKLNQALINWFAPQTNYDAVVIAAANEAGGHGFVTELAGDPAPLADAIYTAADRAQWQEFESGVWEGQETQLIERLNLSYGSWDGFARAMEQSLPALEGIGVEDFLACPSCYPAVAIDAQAVLTAVEGEVVGPVRDGEALFRAHPYVTRLYTTLSADEMDEDPMFEFNPELPELSNVHVATRRVACDGRHSQREAPWTVELREGTVMGVGSGPNSWWPAASLLPPQNDAPEPIVMPTNWQVWQLATVAQGDLLTDNSDAIASALEEGNARVATQSAVDGLSGGGAGGCSLTQAGGGLGSQGAALGWLGLAALLRLARRRRAVS